MMSLPLLPPRLDASLWPSHSGSNTFLDPSTESHNRNAQTNHQRRPGSHHGHGGHHAQHHNPNFRSQLAALTADENTIYQRKQNVRRFGAGWIRPPGVAKTYQAIMDEEAEREEQDILARREQHMLDLQTAQNEAANREAAAEGQDEEMEEGGERDLDDDVPEAEAEESDLSESEEGSSQLEEGETSLLGPSHADVTFNEDSFLEGSVVGADVEHMLEMEEAEMAGVLQDERDLDDDVPEAGSYEHTDTEDDSDSDAGDESRVSVLPTPGNRRSSRRSSGLPSVMSSARTAATRSVVRTARGAQSLHFEQQRSGLRLEQQNPLHLEQQRASMHLETSHRSSFGLDGSSSLLDGSSFLRSSPVPARASLRSRFMGTLRGGGVPPRGS